MRTVLLLVMIMLTMPAHAGYEEESDRPHQEYDMETADELMGLLDLQKKIIQDEAENIESQIKQINPDIVTLNQFRPVEEKVAIYRSWLAQQAYEYYRQYFIDQIKRRSAETGRAVKQTSGQGETNIWLDRGELDEPKCTYGMLYSTCPYPEGFEEIWLNDDSRGELLYQEDDKKKNRTYWAVVQMNNDYNIHKDLNETNIDQSIMLSVFYMEFDYTQYRNFEEANRAYTAWVATRSKKETKRIQKQIKKGQLTEEEIEKHFHISEDDGLRHVTGHKILFDSSASKAKKSKKQ